MPEALLLDDVRIALGSRELMRLSASIEPGVVLTVMGPSGAGKSALVAYIGGFLDPAFTASGRVLSGTDDLAALPPERRHVGVLFQDPLLFPHMTVTANLLFALPETLRGRSARREAAESALASVGLAGFGGRDPDTLSGGEKARVALVRVLLSGPRALLLDEPFSKLDAELRVQSRQLVFDSARAAGLPALLVTHDVADAEAAGGAIVRIDG